MSGCLDGIRVIDLGRYQAGPRCSLILGDLGAEVIKVEAAPDGDESRRLGMVYWSQYNRGKKSITLNLRSETGKQILRELVLKSDMVLQNFSPGVMDEMGFGYAALKQLNPGIILINVSGFGQYGPYRDRRAFVDGIDRIDDTGRQARIERAHGKLLQQRRARWGEDHVELDVRGGVIALLEAGIDRPMRGRGRPDEPDRHRLRPRKGRENERHAHEQRTSRAPEPLANLHVVPPIYRLAACAR